jgi:hypothetical protein
MFAAPDAQCVKCRLAGARGAGTTRRAWRKPKMIFRVRILLPVFGALAVAATALSASAAERMRFWNLTSVTIKELYLAPAGTTAWGANQCKNDADGAVDPDERLTIKGVDPGHYDVKLADKAGRVCTVPNVEVKTKGPYAFSISDKDLTNCAK